MVLAAQIGEYPGLYDVMAFSWDDDLGSMAQRGATISDASDAAVSEDGSTMVVQRTDSTIETFRWDADAGQWSTIDTPLAAEGRLRLTFDASVLVVGGARVKTFDWDASTSQWVSSAADLLSEGDSDRFGDAIAITPDGSAMVVGAAFFPSPSEAAGRVYVYDRNAATGDWDLRAELGADANSDNLGYSVAISADGNLVGASAPCALECDGLVRTWQWDRCSDSVAALPDIVGVGEEELGSALDFSDDGSIFVIGTGYSDKDANGHDEGSLKVYGSANGAWEPLIDTIFGSDPIEYLGNPVAALSSDGLLLTSIGIYHQPKGAVYQYDLIPATAPPKSPMKRCGPVPNGLRKGQIIRSDGTLIEVDGSVIGSDLVVGDGTNEVTIEGTDGVVTPGGTLQVSGRKFRNPEIWIQSNPVLLGSVNTGSSTEFSLEITIPADLAPGLHTLQVEDGSLGIAVGIEVAGTSTTTVPASTTVPGSTTVAPELPSTGSNSGALVVAALGAVGLGVMFTRLRRRVRRV